MLMKMLGPFYWRLSDLSALKLDPIRVYGRLPLPPSGNPRGNENLLAIEN